jgi:hypothetical protein
VDNWDEWYELLQDMKREIERVIEHPPRMDTLLLDSIATIEDDTEVAIYAGLIVRLRGGRAIRITFEPAD